MNESNPSADRVINVFNEALARPPGAEREQFLAAACGTDAKLRAEVDELLSVREEAGSFLKPGAAGSPGLEAEFARLKPEEAGERIGHYKLLEQIGQGGFGTVWVAEQEKPVRRRVALKIIKLGMDTKQVVARFEQERQALAMMDHPNIAKVFDAGASETGRPYFVMELVRGIKITEYCDQANLSTAERLQLFIQVCQAVQHAHQKGIIHRDLKPSNILVTLHDGVAVPKVIDFGVAKATQQQRLTDLTVYTQFEQMVGTPLYMSPEQAEMSGLDIDTRSDIYSLGVLLYELLTGRTPFDPETLMRQGLDEIRRTIREQEPQKPSTFVQTLPFEVRTTVARHRQAEAAKLVGLIRGDLDWIVMKAIEKDRNRRYETANGFAKDIERHLNNEPVQARPPSRAYQLQKLVRRNKLAVAAAGAVAMALIVGLGISTWSLFRVEKQRQFAEQANRAAQGSARDATANELRARGLLAAADLNLAQQALAVNNIGYARRLLDRHRPAPGSVDPRGDWAWRFLWQQCRGNARAVLSQRAARAFSVSVSHDGTRAAVGYGDGCVELWDLLGRRLVRTLQEGGANGRVAFAPTQPLLVFSGGGAVKRLDLATQEEKVLCKADDEVRELAFSPGGNLLAVLDRDGLRVVAMDDGRVLLQHDLGASGQHFNNARFSAAGDRLWYSYGAFARGDKRPGLRCLSLPDRRTLWDMPIDELEGVVVEGGRDLGFSAMDVSPDGRVLVTATAYNDPTISVRDAETGRVIKKLRGHTGWIGELRFSRDGGVLASASADQTLRLWDTATWRKKFDPFRGHNDEVQAVAFSPDASFLVSGGKDGAMMLWDAHGQPPPGGRIDLPDIVGAVPLPEGSAVRARKKDDSIVRLDLVTLAETPLPASTPDPAAAKPKKPAPQLRGIISASEISPDGKLHAVSTEAGFIMLYNARTQREIGPLHGHMQGVFGVAFSPDNRVLASASGGDQAIMLWDVETMQPLLTLPGTGTLLYVVHFTADGNVLLAGEPGKPGSFQFWRAPSWGEIAEAERTTGIWPATTAYEATTPVRPSDLAIRRESLGDQNAETTREMVSLGSRLHKAGKLTEAEEWFRKVVALDRQASRQREPSFAEDLARLGSCLFDQSKYAEAEEVFREALDTYRSAETEQDGGLVDRSLWLSLFDPLARTLTAQNKSAELQALIREELRHARAPDANGATAASPKLALVLHHTALALHAGKALKEARGLAEEAWNLCEQHPDWPKNERQHALQVFADVLSDLGDYAAIESLQRKLIDRLRAKVSEQDPELADALAQLTLLLLPQQKFNEAEAPARESLAIRENATPDDWRTFNSRSMLGASLLGQKKYSEAEPLLLSGYEGMKQRENSIPPVGKARLREVLQRLGELYEATGEKEKAAEWKKKLAEFEEAGTTPVPAASKQ